MRTGRIRLVAAALASCAVLVQAGAADLDRSLAVRYAELARSAASSFRYDDASFYAHRSLDYDASSSDTQVLAARIELALGEPLRGVETHFRAALAADDFRLERRDAAVIALANALARMRGYDDALELIDGLPPGPDARYVEALCLARLGLRERYRAALSKALDDHPSDPRFAALFLSGLPLDPDSFAPDAAERAILERILARLPFLARLDRELPLMAAPYFARVEDRRDAVLEYRASGRKRPEAVLLALRYGVIDEATAIRELFSFRRLERSVLRGLRGELSSDGSLGAFGDAFLAYDGSVTVDADRDGEPEEETLYRHGAVASWRLDADQDGESEAAAAFSENLPVTVRTVTARTPSGAVASELLVDYDLYPYASRAVVKRDGSIRAYAFETDRKPLPIFSLDVEASGTSDGAAAFVYAPVFHAEAVPVEAALLADAARVGTRDHGTEAVFDLAGGIPVASERHDAAGRARVRYRDGFPYREDLDLDGDGIDDARVLYRRGPDGKPERAAFELDADCDGTPEYRELLVPPFAKSWDFDGDGRVDATVEPLPDGAERREFSSRLDGNLDTAIVVRNGAIVSLFRGGKRLTLVPDAGGKVIWIGEKPFDFGAETPATGAGFRNSIRYSVVSFGNQIFAEVHR